MSDHKKGRYHKRKNNRSNSNNNYRSNQNNNSTSVYYPRNNNNSSLLRSPPVQQRTNTIVFSDSESEEERNYNNTIPIQTAQNDFRNSNSRNGFDSNNNSSDYEYVEEVPEEYCCPVCLNPLEDPIEHIQCGNMFCQNCMKQLEEEPCPLCRSPLRLNTKKVTTRMILDKINSLKVYCPNCRQQVERRSLSSHVDACPKKCPWGCDQMIAPKYQDQHKPLCPEVIIQCPVQDDSIPYFECLWKGPRSQITEHLKSCPFKQLRSTLGILNQKIRTTDSNLGEVRSLTFRQSNLQENMQARFITFEANFDRTTNSISKQVQSVAVDLRKLEHAQNLRMDKMSNDFTQKLSAQQNSAKSNLDLEVQALNARITKLYEANNWWAFSVAHLLICLAFAVWSACLCGYHSKKQTCDGRSIYGTWIGICIVECCGAVAALFMLWLFTSKSTRRWGQYISLLLLLIVMIPASVGSVYTWSFHCKSTDRDYFEDANMFFAAFWIINSIWTFAYSVFTCTDRMM